MSHIYLSLGLKTEQKSKRAGIHFWLCWRLLLCLVSGIQDMQELCTGMHLCRIRKDCFQFSLGLLDTSRIFMAAYNKGMLCNFILLSKFSYKNPLKEITRHFSQYFLSISRLTKKEVIQQSGCYKMIWQWSSRDLYFYF